MKIVATADLHGFLPKTPQADLLLVAGDVVPRRIWEKEPQQRWLIENFRPWLDRQEAKQIFFTGGNQDIALEDHLWAKKHFPEYLYLETVEFEEVSIFFSPYSLYGVNLAFRTSQKEIKQIFKSIPKNTDIIVSHGPVRGILDFVDGEGDTGLNVIKTIKKINPSLFLSGHVHPEFGSEQVGETLFLNGSFLNKEKIPAHPLWVIDWDQGIKNFYKELPIEIDVTKVPDKVRYGKTNQK